jgi:hypothetical protein
MGMFDNARTQPVDRPMLICNLNNGGLVDAHPDERFRPDPKDRRPLDRIHGCAIGQHLHVGGPGLPGRGLLERPYRSASSHAGAVPAVDRHRDVCRGAGLAAQATGARHGRLLLEHGALVIAAGGGGIPVAMGIDGCGLQGVDAVIDKDLCSGLLARQLEADCLVIATDVASVFLDWGLPQQRALQKVTPQSLARHVFPQGSMGPKVQAACDFVLATGR